MGSEMCIRDRSIADRGYVLASGEVKMTGTGKDLLDDPSVQKAYLGG